MPCHSTSIVRFERYSGSTQERPSSRNRRPGMARDQRIELELVAGIEAAGDGRALLPQQPVGADDLVGFGAGNRGVEDQKMVAGLVEAVGVALLERMHAAGAWRPAPRRRRGSGPPARRRSRRHHAPDELPGIRSCPARCPSMIPALLRLSNGIALAAGRMSRSVSADCTSDSPSSHPSWRGDKRAVQQDCDSTVNWTSGQ